jgi:hypothetical protein
MIKAIKRNLTMFAIALASTSALADDWPGPQTTEVFSASRNYFVRVIPGNSIGDTVGFKGAKRGNFAKAEFYHRENDRSYRRVADITLSNPVAPVEFFVANSGHVIALDNWHNRGYGQVVVVLAPNGAKVKSYALNELFSDSEIEAFSHSVSSIHWHETPIFFQQDQKTLLITTKVGASLEINAQTGAFQYCETIAKAFRCRATNKDRKWGSHKPISSTPR